MWSGAIGFGLVSVPVQLVPAISEHGLELHEVHDADGGRVRRRRECSVCGEDVPYEHVARGIEQDGKQAVLTEEDMAELPLPSKKLFDVLAFVDATEIDVLQMDRAYLLAPASAAANKPYVLLRDTLRQTDRVAIGKITLRTRESLALLRVHGDLMAVHTMLWPDEIRDPEGLAPPASVKVRRQEIEMASSLMERMSKDFDLDALEDSYQVALRELVLSKVEDRPAKEPVATAAAPSNVVDLMAALQASIDRADEGGKETGVSAAGKARAKKAPAKKTTAKKAEAKKTTGGRKRRTG